MITATITRDDGNKVDVQNFKYNRIDMFRAITRDWLALINDESAPLTPLAPRLSDMRGSCDLIADAWGKRQFTGMAKVAF